MPFNAQFYLGDYTQKTSNDPKNKTEKNNLVFAQIFSARAESVARAKGAFTRFASIGQPINLNTSTALTSLLAFALAACGGGGGGRSTGSSGSSGPPPDVSARAFNGPIEGATVYIDQGTIGIMDAEDIEIATTGQDGAFIIPGEHIGQPLIISLDGATNHHNPNDKTDNEIYPSGRNAYWRAPQNSEVISPLTHLIAEGIMSEAEIKTRFGLDVSLNLLGFDPSQDGTPAQREAVREAGETVGQILEDLPPKPSKQAVLNAIEAELKPDPPKPKEKPKPKEASDTQSDDAEETETETKSATDEKIVTPKPPVTQPTPAVTPKPSEGGTPPVTPQDVEVAIYENHPLNKAIVDLEGDGSFALSKGYKDNKHFKIDSDGKIWWNKLADYEKPKDKGKDNIYEIKVIHTASDGTKTEVEVEVTVGDIGPERVNEALHASRRKVFGFSPTDLKPEDLPSDYVQHLLGLDVWAMPKTGPLILTWAFSPKPNPTYDALADGTRLDEIRSKIESAMNELENYANIKFIEVEYEKYSTDLKISISNTGDYGGRATVNSITFYAKTIGKPDYSIAIHEIGHFLGLSHPFDADGDWKGDEQYRDDPSSIMSYYRGEKTTRGLQAEDIAALQFLYGAPGTDFEGVESLLINPPEYELI